MSLGPRRARKGVSTLAAVLVLLGVLAILSLTRFQASRQLSTQVQRVRLDTLAELQARSAIQEALQRVARAANRRDEPIYRRLRERLGEPWTEIDLSDLVALRPGSIAPTWGRRGTTSGRRAEAEASGLQVRLLSPRAFPGAEDLDEWTALLVIEAVGEVRDARLRVRRRIEERYELRMVRVGLPRPFDQATFLAPLEAVTDPARAQRARRELLAMQPHLVREVLQNMAHQLAPDLRPRLEAIMKGMLPADEQVARTPALPSEPAWVVGFHHVRKFAFRMLDLATTLEVDLARSRDLLAQVTGAALGSPSQVEAVYQLVDAYSTGLRRAWRYGVRTRLHPRDAGPLESHLHRLDPEGLAARAALTGTPKHPRLARWLAGELRIDGVLDLRGTTERLTLTGELMGQVMVLVGPAGVRLEGVNVRAPARGDRLVVVAVGGDIELGGDVRAQLLSLPQAVDQPDTAGAVRMDPSTRLVGGLVAPYARRGQLELDGLAIPDSAQAAPWPPVKALDEEDGGGYQVVLAPEPMWTQREAR